MFNCEASWRFLLIGAGKRILEEALLAAQRAILVPYSAALAGHANLNLWPALYCLWLSQLSPSQDYVLLWSDGSSTSNYLFRGGSISGSAFLHAGPGDIKVSRVPVSAGVARNLRIELNVASTANHTYTVRKNGVDTSLSVMITAISVTITAGGTSGADTTHTAGLR